MARSAKTNMASQKVQMSGFYESLSFHRTFVLIVCQYIFIVICGSEVQYTTAVIHTAYSLALLKLLAVASTSLGKGSAFGGAVKSTDHRLRQTDGAGLRLAAGEAPRS